MIRTGIFVVDASNPCVSSCIDVSGRMQMRRYVFLLSLPTPYIYKPSLAVAAPHQHYQNHALELLIELQAGSCKYIWLALQ